MPDVITPVTLSPSERLLREMLAMSVADDCGGISDVIVIWTDTQGVRHVRDVNN